MQKTQSGEAKGCKEKIKIYENKLDETLLTYEIIKLNGKIFYVSHTEYVIQNGKSTRLFEELYYDNKYYIKIPFEENQRKPKEIDSFSTVKKN